MKLVNIFQTTIPRIMAALLVSTLGLGVVAPAFAQSSDLKPVLDRLQRIERDIKTLNIQVSQGGAAGGGEVGSSAAARIAVRLTDLEDELRTTTGKVESVANQIEGIGLRLDKLIADLDYRLSALESGKMQGTPRVSAAPSPAGVQQAQPGASQPGVLGVISQSEVPLASKEGEEGQAVAPVSGEAVATGVLPAAPARPMGVLPEGTAKEQYAYAFALLRKADYDQAEVALNEFLKAHPDDPLSGNARYWLAESYYVRGQYVQAAEAFVAGYQADANGPKAPDMLLKLGMSMSNLDKKAEACASFGKLLKDFPKAPGRILSKVEFESNKIGCE
ncbi:MAG: tol-pal system protein YbgF [Rhodospirillales bacterium]|nr:tol-pal system protein YbgF [Rhodospirillales bacterium]